MVALALAHQSLLALALALACALAILYARQSLRSARSLVWHVMSAHICGRRADKGAHLSFDKATTKVVVSREVLVELRRCAVEKRGGDATNTCHASPGVQFPSQAQRNRNVRGNLPSSLSSPMKSTCSPSEDPRCVSCMRTPLVRPAITQGLHRSRFALAPRGARRGSSPRSPRV